VFSFRLRDQAEISALETSLYEARRRHRSRRPQIGGYREKITSERFRWLQARPE
jgi:hypothetical protein